MLTALPEIMPNRHEAVTAILAEPPRKRPIKVSAISVKNAEPPEANSRLPKNTKAITMVAATITGRPSMLPGSQVR